jgi:hypothetical protein
MKPLVPIIAATALVTLLGGATAQAQPTAPTWGPPAFEAVDQNGNGVISPDELQAFHAARMAQRAQLGYPMRYAAQGPMFSTFDRNGDGGLTPDEYPPWRGQAMGRYGRGWRGGHGGPGPGPCWRTPVAPAQ